MTRHVILLNSDKPEVLRALAARPDVRLRVITRKCYADLYTAYDTAFIDSFENLSGVERVAYELARNGPVDHVIAATEKSVVAAGLIRSLLGVPGPTFDESMWGAHKRAMKQRLRSAGLPVTDFAQATDLSGIPDAACRTGWPVIVKPVFGSGSKCTYRIDSAEEFTVRHADGEFDALAERGLPVQVERLVRFHGEFHCDGVVREGAVRFAAVSRYFAPPLQTYLNGAYFIDQESTFAQDVLDLHAKVTTGVHSRLSWPGVAMTVLMVRL